MENIKFRQPIYLNGEFLEFHYWGWVSDDIFKGPISLHDANNEKGQQFTGLFDKDGKEIYCGDVIEFDNSDIAAIRQEDWLEFYIDWIGTPKCEDQARDFYRIRHSSVIGNIYESPELLETE